MRLFLINGRFLFTNQHQRVYLCYQRTFLYQLANGNGQRTTGVLINHVLLWFIVLWLAVLEPAIGVWRGQLIRYRLWSRDKHKINTLFISILAVHPAMMWITCRTSALALGAPWWNRTVKKMLQNAGPAGSYPVNRNISGKNRRNFASWELLMAQEYWGEDWICITYFDEAKNLGDTHFLFNKNRIRFFVSGWVIRDRYFELKKLLGEF